MFVGQDKWGNVFIYKSKECYETVGDWWKYIDYIPVQCSIATVVKNQEHFRAVISLLKPNNLCSGRVVEERELDF